MHIGLEWGHRTREDAEGETFLEIRRWDWGGKVFDKYHVYEKVELWDAVLSELSSRYLTLDKHSYEKVRAGKAYESFCRDISSFGKQIWLEGGCDGAKK